MENLKMNTAILNLYYALIISDGNLDDNELIMASKLKIFSSNYYSESIHDYTSLVRQTDFFSVIDVSCELIKSVNNEDFIKNLIIELIILSKADDEIVKDEVDTIHYIKDQLELSDDDFNEIIESM
ncbi:MAG: hypothetical protein BWY70_00289 [Bacteroidetes bacterium ADurb.Bin408]|nr:MAG: hypothetical protein BWY70_00289 [Bacteroidetes bacterium ADurb.Bin408]